MIGLMRDARPRVSEAAVLTWGDLEQVLGGSGCVRDGEIGHRVVSADTVTGLPQRAKPPRGGAAEEHQRLRGGAQRGGSYHQLAFHRQRRQSQTPPSLS